MFGEPSKCRERLKHFCIGNGLDLSYGGDPILPSAITVDLPRPYTHVGNGPLHLAGDARDLYWFRNNVLDYVYSSHLLEDFENTYDVLKEWLRVIKPGGYLILYCPDELTYREHCRKTGQSYNYSHKIKDFSLKYVKKILTDRFVNIKIVHENPLVDEYSFELVVQKLEKEISKESIQPFQQSLNGNNMLIPPLEKIFDGSKSIEEFIQIGDEFLKYFIYYVN